MFEPWNLDNITNSRDQCRCWLLDVAEQVPVTWHLTGFDMSTDQFPTSAYLPRNVSLQQMDAFETIPPALVESFDIVHVRAVCVIVKGGDPSLLIENVVKLLSTVHLVFSVFVIIDSLQRTQWVPSRG